MYIVTLRFKSNTMAGQQKTGEPLFSDWISQEKERSHFHFLYTCQNGWIIAFQLEYASHFSAYVPPSVPIPPKFRVIVDSSDFENSCVPCE